MRDPFPVSRERIPGVGVASQEEALSTGKARGTPGSCHHSKSPPDVSVHSRGTGFPCTALTFKPRIDSHHVCTWDSPVGKASWESLVGKTRGKTIDALILAEDRLKTRVHVGQPCGKAWWERLVGKTRGKNIDPLIHAADCMTLLLPLLRERIPGVPIASQEEALSTGKARGNPGSCHLSKSPPDVSVHSKGPCFPCTALTFKPRIDSHHVCTWYRPVESLVGKPPGKDSRENHRSFDPRSGLRDTAATTLEESASACPHSKRGLTPLGRLQKYPKIHVSTGEESSGSGPDSTQGLRPWHRQERNPERPPRNSHGDWPFLRPPERVPDGPVGKNSRRSRRISRGGALHRKGERNSRVVPPFEESPRCVSPFQKIRFSLHCLDVQAENRLPPRVHMGQS
ncbi:hypothetical protein MJG53_010831 [Ovis ammon polii x Ovis aries]|uniref:Uncharacterized protein n=1 Tax=Ovis ammon polii x Ovis aries TaxID=2918886 RepID=A0ACB9URL3_9CETA|nr:hypothetical protein MJG53_010831 [Ovis ammon polii x Ovis aries]